MSYQDYKLKKKSLIIETIQEIINVEGLDVKDRTRSLANRRFYLMYYLRRNTVLTHTEIASMFGKAVTNHASSIHGIRTHYNLMEYNDLEYIKNIQVIKDYLKEEFSSLIE
tara:strand:- start:2638 stop:2970 length:333 start_codon:yes stop_codon:yes gene_type:complete